ncbi:MULTISPECIES: restriction endonuclease subunit S [Arcobacteraceae]|uniref:Restriction endonuclease subunit S n=2 Tax=Arcobacteraceae TaxID=2808963 RepID=A0AAP4Q0I7_9BACT|nr:MULTISPECIES: restriction endonuclease subunit S [Arcobacteraceae]MDN5053082.1 restriction endonuclease subunit S [Aliarcobacter butzleri]MDN5076184.1 restriction endonuclease subunit S [Aliarcobacter butzleri]MDN5117505.1 restriction endonuclease subunit S [Aliarcobacter butzleri]MDN5133305.1 restriction endonuclease subunit S [Aliarcobacter butzleri]NUW27261.1 restriction endonuclease subunit S [Aliarcobacter butzleri]
MSKLKDVSILITKGTTPSTIGESFINEGINYVKSESITGSKYLDKNSFAFISEETNSKLKRSQLKENDLLFSIAGAYLGKIAIVRKVDLKANTNQAVGIVRADTTKVNVDYLYYYFSQKQVNEYINKLSSQSSQPNLNLDLLGNLSFDNKTLDIQKKIANILSSLDSKIELNNKINKELEAMGKTLYDYWFVQFDFPDENGKPYKSSGGKMVYNQDLKREIPERWEVKKLQEFLEFEKGIEPGASEYLNLKMNENCVKFFRVGDIQSESSVYIDSTNKNYKIVNERDVIVTFDGSVGKLGFGLKGVISGGLRKIYDKSGKFDNSLIYFIFCDIEIIKTIHRYATGSILLHASSSIEHLKIVFKEEFCLKFQKIVKPIFDQMIQNRKQNQELAKLRDWLLPMLMNGQVRVK